MKWLISWIALLCTLSSVRCDSKEPIIECLLNQSFYHEDTGKCEELHDEEPCGPGEWLIRTDEPGVVTCKLKPVKLSECETVLGPGGYIQCEKTSELFQACSDGVYVPENFQEDTIPCPHMYQCQARNELYYSSINSASNYSHELVINHLDTLICDHDNKLICLPENNNDYLITVKNILQSFQRPEIKCEKNPCKAGKWPTLDQAGYYRCGSIKLVPFSVLLSGVNRSKCRRRQVYIYGKCRPRFFG